MPELKIYTLDDDDETIEQVISVLQLGIGIAQEAETISPENEHALRMWINSERRRINPLPQRLPPPDPDQAYVSEALRSSRYFSFWESLQADQEVRWTGTKTATYFVVDPHPSPTPPDGRRHGTGAWIQLRRHSGKTFWSHIAQIRPVPEREVDDPHLRDTEPEGSDPTGDL